MKGMHTQILLARFHSAGPFPLRASSLLAHGEVPRAGVEQVRAHRERQHAAVVAAQLVEQEAVVLRAGRFGRVLPDLGSGTFSTAVLFRATTLIYRNNGYGT